MLYSSDAPTDGLQYTVTSGQVEPTTATLAETQHIPAAISGTYLGFKSKVTPQLTAIARQVTQGKDHGIRQGRRAGALVPVAQVQLFAAVDQPAQ